MKYIIYTTPNCQYCKKAKAWIEKDGSTYEEFNLRDPVIWSLFKEAYPDPKDSTKSSFKSAPIVFDDQGNLVMSWQTDTKL